jgi:hypothetical protein
LYASVPDANVVTFAELSGLGLCVGLPAAPHWEPSGVLPSVGEGAVPVVAQVDAAHVAGVLVVVGNVGATSAGQVGAPGAVPVYVVVPLTLTLTFATAVGW